MSTISVQDLLGSWKLVSWRLWGEDGAVRLPLGDHPTGLLIYAPDGYMSATLMGPDRPHFAGADPLRGSPEERATAMAGYHTYGGRYRIEGDRVIHSVEFALFPNIVGGEQVRYPRFEDGMLVLATPTLVRAGATGKAELVWRRISGD